MKQEKILIVGGVAAGATAAARARRMSSDAHIVLLEAGPDISFANCGLPYYIGGDIESRSKLILQSPESFNQQYDVEVHVNTSVTAIDRANQTVQAVDVKTGATRSFAYTKLILAQGGRPINPELPGANQDNVFTLWTMDDMDKIDAYIRQREPKHAVVVGGGFIGLEMVEALVKRGLKVSVVEKMPHVMALMEAEIAGFIERELRSYGVGVHTNAGVKEIRAKEVLLDNDRSLKADLVLMSIGVRPTLKLAQEAGLDLGPAGGLLVNEFLQTSDRAIYAAGDMVEIEHRVNNTKVRIPLAGPANRQGRIAAENALGGQHPYKGAIGTSVVRVFEAVAGTTGLSLKQARALGIDADAVVVHKEHHTSYFPGAETVTAMLVYDKQTGVILGGQTAGYKGADKRLDVIATATATKLHVSDIADIDFAYSPPIGTANDAMNMLAYVAENKMSGYSPSIMASELETYVIEKRPIALDLREVFDVQKAQLQGAAHLPLEMLAQNMDRLPKDTAIVLYCANGKKGHQALRMLKNAGFAEVVNVSGGYTSIERHAMAVGYKYLQVGLLPIEKKSIDKLHEKESSKPAETAQEPEKSDDTSTLVVDVRTRGEFKGGSFPNAINIPLDEIMAHIDLFGHNQSREIVVFCASGARSAYAQQVLRQMGYSNVINGGSVSQMMRRYQHA